MTLNVGTLSATLGLDSKPFDREMDGAGSRGGALLGKAKLAAAGAVVAVAEFGRRSLTNFAGFESGMNEVFTLLPGISDSAMKKMSGQVQGFATDFGVLPDQVVPALYQSLSAGVPPGNVFDFLETAQKAAKGGVTDLTTAVDGISSVVNAYGDQIGGAAEASDLMFTAVRLGKTNMAELSSSLFNVTPTAAALGVKFGDVTAAMATMTAQGIPTSVATTQMRQMLVELSKEGSNTSDVFKEIAGKSFKQFVAEGGNTQDALKLLEDHAKKSGVGINDLFGSVEAGSAALSLTGKGAESFTNALGEMENSAGATDQAYGQMAQGLSFAFDKIKARAAVTMLKVGEWLGPRILKAIEIGQKAFQRVADWWDEHGPAISEVVGEFVGKVGDSFEDLSQWVEDSWDDISESVGHVLAVIQGLWDTFGSRILSAAKRVWDFVARTIENNVKLVQGVIQTVMALINGDWGKAWDGVKKVAAAVWDQLKNMISLKLGLIKDGLGLALDGIKKLWSLAWDATKRVAHNAWEAIKRGVRSAIDSIIDWFRGLPGRAKSALGNLLSTLKEKGKDLVRGLKNGIASLWNDVSGWLGRLPGKIVGAIGSLGSILIGAGKAAMKGLKDGFIEGFKDAAGYLGSLPGKIIDKKGPPAYDATILIGNGKLIMQGLKTGMLRGFPEVESAAKSVADLVAAAAATPNLAAIGAGFGGLSAAAVSNPLLDEVRMLRAEIARMRPVQVSVDGLTDRTAARLGARVGAELSMRGGF